ncbi:hypothetical protein A2U01_0079830, partial [Trifolium medium]|nr:hypothetical protein [Trifolium medium]
MRAGIRKFLASARESQQPSLEYSLGELALFLRAKW